MNIPATINHFAIASPLQQNGTGHGLNRERSDNGYSQQQSTTGNDRAPADFVYRGELLDSTGYQNRNQPQSNQQVSPQNRLAIENYLASDQATIDDDPRGRLLDRFV